MRISVSKGSDLYAKDGHNHFITQTLSFEKLPDIMTTKAWSPVIWNQGLRASNGFVEASLIALDFDNGSFGISDVVSFLTEYSAAYIIGTTKSHMKPKSGVTCERFRVVIKASCTGKYKLYRQAYEQLRHAMKHDLAAAKGIDRRQAPDVFDTSCASPARFFFPCTGIVRTAMDGLDWQFLQPEYDDDEMGHTKWRETQAAIKGRAEYLPPSIKRLAWAAEGERNTSLFKLAAYMLDAGFDQDGIIAHLSRTKSTILTLPDKEIRAVITNARRYRARPEPYGSVIPMHGRPTGSPMQLPGGDP